MEKQVFNHKKLREARQSKGLRVAVVAEKLGVTETTVRYWEQGNREPSFETLGILLPILDLTANDVLNLPFKAA